MCKVLLNTEDLKWHGDHFANLKTLERFADFHLDLGSQLEKHRELTNSQAAQLNILRRQHEELKDQLEEARTTVRSLDTKVEEMNEQCHALVQTCGLEWHEDHSTN